MVGMGILESVLDRRVSEDRRVVNEERWRWTTTRLRRQVGKIPLDLESESVRSRSCLFRILLISVRVVTEERFDRYEPSNYSKRRAISPAPGISSTLGSPILSHAQPLPLPTPPPIPSSLILSTSLPITIPSPTFAHHSFFSSLNHRRGSIGTASSPGHYSRPASPAPSSLSSSAGGRGNNFATQNSSMIMGLMSGRAEREEERTNGGSKMGETGDGLGRMKLD